MDVPSKEAFWQPLEKRIAIHAAVGLSLAFPLYLGIVSRSLSSGLTILLFEGFLALPLLAGWLIKKPTPAARRIGGVIITGWLLYILFYGLQVLERFYLVNASTYPTWLAGFQENVSDPMCESGFAQIFEKENGVLLRCGFTWTEGKTVFIGNPASLERGEDE